MRRFLTAVVLLAAAAGVRPAYGDGEDERRDARDVRLFEMGALTARWSSFITDRGPYPVRPDEVNDNSRPLYADETEEGASIATADEVVAEVNAAISREEGADGERSLAVSGSRLVAMATVGDQRRIGERLAAIERAGLETAIVDVLVVEGDVPVGDDALPAALASG